MDISDRDYLESIGNAFDFLPLLFNADIALGLTDTEHFLITRQPESFKLNVKEGMELVKGGASEKAILSKTIQKFSYPKEAFGFPIIGRAVPVINSNSGNAVGTVVFAMSQEKENNVIEVVNDLKSYAEQLTASAQAMASSAEEMSSSSQNINELANEASTGINKMDDILNYITEISNTTNLLGLNASIEAARAGEHGRGFTVVAQEIRKLATQSKTSVVDITNSLKTIKNDINNILDFINAFASTSESQAAQAEQLSSSSEGISELSARLLKLAKELNA